MQRRQRKSSEEDERGEKGRQDGRRRWGDGMDMDMDMEKSLLVAAGRVHNEVCDLESVSCGCGGCIGGKLRKVTLGLDVEFLGEREEESLGVRC